MESQSTQDWKKMKENMEKIILKNEQNQKLINSFADLDNHISDSKV